MHPAYLRNLHIASAAALLVIAVLAAPASAQSNDQWVNGVGGIIGGLINQAIIDNAVKSWEAVDPDVRQCLTRSYGISPAQLARQGVTADDSRLSPYMQSCRQAVAQAHAQADARQAAFKSWNAINGNLRECLISRYSLNLSQLVLRGITAEDPSISAQVQGCKQTIAAAGTAWNAMDPKVRRCMVDRGLDPDQLAQKGIGPDAAPVRNQAEACRDRIARHQQLVHAYGNKEADLIENHTVTVGMSKDAVRESVGPPSKIETIPPNDEMWIYGSMRIAISHGKVTYVGH